MSKSKYAAFFFSLILISSLALTSCGKTDMYNLDGRWKFDDGSVMSFDTKSLTYSARGESNSTSGKMEIYNYGVLETKDSAGDKEYYELQVSEKGFIINFQQMEIPWASLYSHIPPEVGIRHTLGCGNELLQYGVQPVGPLTYAELTQSACLFT